MTCDTHNIPIRSGTTGQSLHQGGSWSNCRHTNTLIWEEWALIPFIPTGVNDCIGSLVSLQINELQHSTLYFSTSLPITKATSSFHIYRLAVLMTSVSWSLPHSWAPLPLVAATVKIGTLMKHISQFVWSASSRSREDVTPAAISAYQQPKKETFPHRAGLMQASLHCIFLSIVVVPDSW